MSDILTFPGGTIDVSGFRRDSAPTRTTICGEQHDIGADAPDECDVDCHCGRHLRTPAIAERYVRLQDRARRVAR